MDTNAAPVEVVAGIVVDGGRVLLCHRSAARTWYPDVWDLPGGHRERGEPPARALVRELEEELGIVIEEPSGPEFRHLRTGKFDMRVWIVTRWAGSPTNASPEEHDEVAWMSAQELSGLPLAHHSYPFMIAQALTT